MNPLTATLGIFIAISYIFQKEYAMDCDRAESKLIIIIK